MGIGKGTGRGGSRPNTGGARPNSGPKKKPPLLVKGIDSTDYKTFLAGVMGNEEIDIKERIGAAKVLAALDKKPGANKPLGKKEQLKAEANDIAGGEDESEEDDDTFSSDEAPNVTKLQKRA